MTTGLPFSFGLMIALALLIATLVGARLMARRAAGPVEVRITGEVPPLPDWLPATLDDFVSGPNGGTTQFSDVLDGPILLGHHARISMPALTTELQLQMQPHLVLADRPRSYPVVVLVEIVQAPKRTGLSRLVFGRTAGANTLRARSRLQHAIARRAKGLGLIAEETRYNAGGALVAAGLVFVAAALVAILVAQLNRSAAEDAAESSATPRFPAGAAECPAPSKTSAKPNSSTAVAKGTSCAFADAVRAAYANKATGKGKTLDLGKVRYDAKTTIPVTCIVGKPVIVCKGANKTVYLR